MKKLLLVLLLSTGLYYSQSLAQTSLAQTSLVQNSDRFFGSIHTGKYDPEFTDYFNQITPENSGKWGQLEITRDEFNWTLFDRIYKFALDNNLQFKQHTWVWGQQEPAWMADLPPEEQKEEVIEWIRAYAERYPETDFLDVVNEPLIDHAPPSFKDALGGDGETGWDWVIWSFEQARALMPNTKLLLNDYSILCCSNNLDIYMDIIGLLHERQLIDGIGVQAHGLEKVSPTLVKTSLDRLATFGLPIYISELDINIADDYQQLEVYKNLFPILWEHEAVEGLTLWGHRAGGLWLPHIHLIDSFGDERPAMRWLKSYLGDIEADVSDIFIKAKKHPTPPLAITGINHGLMMNVLDFRDEFAKLELGAIRFPPGNIADEQPLDDVVLKAFKAQWKLLDQPPVVFVANLFTGDAEQALNAAKIIEEMGIPIHAWEIGNEPDLYAPNRDDASWTPEKYCEYFRDFRQALERHNPDYRFMGPAVSGADIAEPFLKSFLELCGDVVDILSWHIYPTDGTTSDEYALSTVDRTTETIQRYRQWLKDPDTNPLGFERDDITLAITEFGLSWKTETRTHLIDMIATLWLADSFGQMLNEGLEESYYFALQGLGGHGLIDNAYWQRPTYVVFEQLVRFRGDVLELELTDDAIRAYAVETDNGLELMVINLNTTDRLTKLSLPFDYDPLAQQVLLSDETYELYDDPPLYESSEVYLDEQFVVPARALMFFSVSKLDN